jgi:hypothetical protein
MTTQKSAAATWKRGCSAETDICHIEMQMGTVDGWERRRKEETEHKMEIPFAEKESVAR